jgi:hypothetical protein
MTPGTTEPASRKRRKPIFIGRPPHNQTTQSPATIQASQWSTFPSRASISAAPLLLGFHPRNGLSPTTVCHRASEAEAYASAATALRVHSCTASRSGRRQEPKDKERCKAQRHVEKAVEELLYTHQVRPYDFAGIVDAKVCQRVRRWDGMPLARLQPVCLERTRNRSCTPGGACRDQVS